MRTLTAGEITALQAAHRKHYWRLEVEDAYGDYNDLTEALEGGEISSTVDRTVIEGRFRLGRASSGGSLSPYVTDALAAGRSIRLYHYCTLAGASAPDAEDYRLVFDGEIDRVNAGGDPVELQCRDGIGAFVADRWTRRLTIAPLTFPTGTTLDAIVQAIITPIFPIDGATAPALEIPSPTGVAIAAPLELDKAPMLENIRNTAQRIGWTVRPVWSDDESGFVLRLYEPPRDSEDVTWTYATNRYKAIPNLQQDREDIVNSVDVWFLNAATGIRLNVHADNEESAAKYGERWAEIIEADNSPISNSTLAQQLADSLISDLAEPLVEAEVTAPLHPYLDIDDRITLASYPLTHGTDQTLAIVGYTHRFGPATSESLFRVRGKPTGGVRKWRPATKPDMTDSFSILSLDEVYRSADGTVVTFRASCGPLVGYVLAYRVRFKQATDVLADPYTYAEDNLLNMEIHEPTIVDLRMVVDLTYAVPPEGYVDYIVLRPYHVTDDGQWVPGPAWNSSILPYTQMQPIVATDDHETATHGYFWIRLQDRGLALTSITMGRQTSPSNIVQGLAPTRGPGEASVAKGGTLGEGEYEAEVALPVGWQSWLWFDLVFEGTHTMRVMSPPLGPNRAPSFAGTVPLVVGTTIWIHGDNVRSVKVERKTGATWEVDRDTTLPIGIDVAQQDDSGNPGLSSGTGAFLVTIYSDPIAQRDGETMTDAQSVNVTAAGGSATYSLDIMTVSAPAIGDTVGHVTYKASSSTPAIDTRRRYSVGGAPFGAWAAVAAASPDPAPTSSTQYAISALPTARLITGQIDPPQYTVEVQVEGTLLDGGTEHDVQVRSFSYTTNADDV